MKHRTLIIALAAALGLAALAGIAGYTLGQRKAADATAATPAAADSRKVLYWHDPMVPGHKFDKPGKSPFMDMQLVPVYADDAPAGDGVRIDPRIRQNLGIRTATVEAGSLSAPLPAIGTVAWNERDVALVQSRGNGYLERLYVRAPLDHVRQGQPLAELYIPDWVAAQEEYLAVRRDADTALLDAARQRMRLAGMTDAQIRQVETAGKVQARVTITAPVSGVVTELAAREGMTVATGTPLFRINGAATVWLDADIPEQSAAQVRAGAMVEGRAAALPDTPLKGQVSALLPDLNPATRTIKARIELANPGQRLVPGMFVNLTLRPDARREVLLVPSEALIRTGTRTVAMVEQAGGGFQPVDVETGLEADGRTEIRQGLKAGDKVVVSGQFLVDSEASLRGTATRMDGAHP